MDYSEKQSADGLAKVFKVKPGDQVIKEISPDGSSITFRKIPTVSDKTKQTVADILNEDRNLIQALKDL